MTLSTIASQHIALTGDKARFKELLRQRLTECGWRDQVKLLCRQVVKDNDDAVTVDMLIKEVTPKARSLVPDTVKKELLHKIKTRLMSDDKLNIDEIDEK